jgi:hypothetical protein
MVARCSEGRLGEGAQNLALCPHQRADRGFAERLSRFTARRQVALVGEALLLELTNAGQHDARRVPFFERSPVLRQVLVAVGQLGAGGLCDGRFSASRLPRPGLDEPSQVGRSTCVK